jgi:hypothetical protein
MYFYGQILEDSEQIMRISCAPILAVCPNLTFRVYYATDLENFQAFPPIFEDISTLEGWHT